MAKEFMKQGDILIEKFEDRAVNWVPDPKLSQSIVEKSTVELLETNGYFRVKWTDDTGPGPEPIGHSERIARAISVVPEEVTEALDGIEYIRLLAGVRPFARSDTHPGNGFPVKCDEKKLQHFREVVNEWVRGLETQGRLAVYSEPAQRQTQYQNFGSNIIAVLDDEQLPLHGGERLARA